MCCIPINKRKSLKNYALPLLLQCNISIFSPSSYQFVGHSWQLITPLDNEHRPIYVSFGVILGNSEVCFLFAFDFFSVALFYLVKWYWKFLHLYIFDKVLNKFTEDLAVTNFEKSFDYFEGISKKGKTRKELKFESQNCSQYQISSHPLTFSKIYFKKSSTHPQLSHIHFNKKKFYKATAHYLKFQYLNNLKSNYQPHTIISIIK